MKKNDKRILVIGSVAYDHLMRYKGTFQEKILPQSLHALSVSFLVSERQTFFGGCGGNIAFHLKKLGEDPLLIGLIGNDFQNYEAWFSQHKVDTSWLIRDHQSPTSAAFVVTDQKGHQIALFDPGAAATFSDIKQEKLEKSISKHASQISFAIISPTNKNLMLMSVDLCRGQNIPYFFDPGQVIQEFSTEELRQIIPQSRGIFVNEYEMQFLLKQTDWSRQTLETRCPIVIETLGEKGSLISFQGKTLRIETVHASTIEDPTGCGDAYRAGFLHIYKDKNDLKKAGDFASRLSSQILMKKGTQVEV